MPKKEEKKKKSKKEKKSKGEESVEKSSSLSPVEVISPETKYEASQLFLRYDQSRSGYLNKSDFLALIQDLNGRNHWGKRSLVRPFTLTDSIGIPLGFERTGQNTQFEAGQLFERYDPNHTGTIQTEAFGKFYHDFKVQLSPFFHQLYLENDMGPPVRKSEIDLIEKGAEARAAEENTTLESLYQSKLSQLQSILEYSITEKKQQMLDRVVEIQTEIYDLNKTKSIPRAEDVVRLSMLKEEMKELRADLDEIEKVSKQVEIITENVSIVEMRRFLQDFPQMFKTAEKIAKRVMKPQDNTPDTTIPFRKYENAVTMLKVKDQVIWELVQERDALRKRNADIESDVKELSKVSTEEMQEWAKYVKS